MSKNVFSLKGRVVVITGGSGFLGKQYILALRGYGAKVVNWDITEGIDITDRSSLKKATSEALKKFGRIDVFITNAALNSAPGASGKEAWAPYEKFSQTLWEKELLINLTG